MLSTLRLENLITCDGDGEMWGKMGKKLATF